MVAVPADASCHMQCQFREEAEERGDLIGNHFCRMIMAVIHQRQAFFLVCCRKTQRKLGRPCCVSFHADPEYLGLYAGFYLREIVGLGKDRFDGLFITHTGPHPVSRNILEAVACPDVHHAGHSCFFRKIVGDTDTCFSVLDPEVSCLFVRA